ncbi:MAG: hypothetical protein CMM52_06440 [Rhodospirillaceae bacterium]|nr:hypothetical protein [Rhodospirillaceae bacterium]|tara:strand:- start:9911 stop:10588 length:678 start_codon:yes stop_codon:yes gene_type:complete
MELSAAITLALGAAWASGLNLYAAVATLGLLGVTGNLDLPPDLQILQHPIVIAAAGFMYFVEFVADKVPGVDSTWDTLHTFIRIPAGAALAAGAVGDVSTPVQLAAILLGGGVTAGTHALKAGSRILINTSPEPFSNWGASVVEDGLVIGGVTLIALNPTIFLILLGIFVAIAIWLLPKIVRGIKRLWDKLYNLVRRDQKVPKITLRPGNSDNQKVDPPPPIAPR